jgi:LPXTG-site transpeptidase (sortase) family protein
MPKITLRQFNNFLNVLVVFVAIYILFWPVYPLLSLWIQKTFDASDGYVYKSKLVADAGSDTRPIPSDNRLVIPALRLDEPILEGKHLSTINKGGTWHRPSSSDPSRGGNTVIAGHRFTYNGSSVFYSLDKLKPGDNVLIYWEGKEYDYVVSKSKVVGPRSTEIEAPTKEPTVTLFTCTPLWNAKKRLVVTAALRGSIYE